MRLLKNQRNKKENQGKENCQMNSPDSSQKTASGIARFQAHFKTNLLDGEESSP
jgi:hypothetical protein